MTTIATDGRSIAADGRTTAGSEVLTDTHGKLWELADGSVVGSCGDRANSAKAKSELHAALVEQREPVDVDGDYRLLRLFPSGAIALYDSGILSHPQWVQAPFSIGSGGEFARGALAAGASLRKAMKIAADYDVHTGPVITIKRP